MAKNWTYNDTDDVYTLVRTYKAIGVMDLVVDIEILYPAYVTYDEAQRGVIVNGLKQKLDDATARSKDEKLTDAEKRVIQEAISDRLLIERKYNAESKERGPMTSLIPAILALHKAKQSVDMIARTFSKSETYVQGIIDAETEEVPEEVPEVDELEEIENEEV